jgi:peptide deformylase
MEIILVDFVSDKKELAKVCKKCAGAQGHFIGRRLLEVLEETKDGVGLAANQIGIDASVCVVIVTSPMIFINPKIVGKFGKSFFQEACLSFPGDYVVTERWMNIVVKTDNHKNHLFFSFDKSALECVCVQHEIDHLNGLTMFDRVADMEVFNV